MHICICTYIEAVSYKKAKTLLDESVEYYAYSATVSNSGNIWREFPADFFLCNQGDQIGRIFAHRVSVYFGHIFYK
jgi:hypothetical protein